MVPNQTEVILRACLHGHVSANMLNKLKCDFKARHVGTLTVH